MGQDIKLLNRATSSKAYFTRPRGKERGEKRKNPLRKTEKKRNRRKQDKAEVTKETV